ncbi:MAG TPA: ABC transporter permease [Ktedonobacteraceae bacterium]|nr:ABC transporter permease [Ktedonobacteraceae bacterium]
MAETILSNAPTPETEHPPQNTGKGFWSRLGGVFLRQREASILVVAIALTLYFQFSSSNFLTKLNILTLFEFISATAIISAGEVMLLICGEIDLSVGMVFAFAPFIMYFVNQAGFSLWIGIIVALLICAVVGLVNGLVTVIFKIPSLIATLGTQFLLNGITLTLSMGQPVLTPVEGQIDQIFGVNPYSEIIWAVIVMIVVQILLSFTRWGKHTVATGGNLLGASEAGVNVNGIKIGNFMLASTLAGFAGILEAFRITSTDPLAGGTTIMFSAVAGAVIGGTALTGGLGTVVGAFLGVVALSILNDGFTLLGVSAYTYDIILGLAILIAMALNIRLSIWREAGKQ